MPHSKDDRRTRRTRQALRDALLGLLRERRYEAISVQDIIERADVARSTFYDHYLDKDDLLLGSHGIFTASQGDQPLPAAHDAPPARLISARLWFEHIGAQKHVLATMSHDTALDMALANLRGIIRRDIEQRVASLPDPAIPPTVVTEYLTGALTGLITWWVAEGMTYTPEQMDAMFQQLVGPGLAAMVGQGSHAQGDH